MTTTTPDAARLLAHAHEHEPGLWKTLTAECVHCEGNRVRPVATGTMVDYSSERAGRVVDWCESCDGNGRVPLPPAEYHVALEQWWVQEKAGEILMGTNGVSIRSMPLAIPWRGGLCLVGVVLAALEAK